MALLDFLKDVTWANLLAQLIVLGGAIVGGYYLKNATQIRRDRKMAKSHRAYTKERLNNPHDNIRFKYGTDTIEYINPYWLHVDEEGTLYVRGYEQGKVAITFRSTGSWNPKEENLIRTDNLYLRTRIEEARMKRLWLEFDTFDQTRNMRWTVLKLKGLASRFNTEQYLLQESAWSKNMEKLNQKQSASEKRMWAKLGMAARPFKELVTRVRATLPPRRK